MSPVRDVPNSVSFPALERQVLERWKAERTFERSLRRREGAPEFVFYDGPPFATGLPHYGHILTTFIKDVVPRYFTMRGYHVPRRWGWDCHGLPVEHEVEKALGFASRADVVRHGIDRFNQSCRSTVMRYAAEWESAVTRLGRWVDFEHAYRTMDPDFVESVVWCFKTLHQRGLVYQGHKVVAYCARCQTALSNFEAGLDDAYRERDDLALTVRFARADAPEQAFLAWTTTPWTLPSNVALAVHPGLEYLRLERDGQSVWLAAAARERYAPELAGHALVERRQGRELAGWGYRRLFPLFEPRGAFRVVASESVSPEEGTGIVHLAPAFGEEDQAVCAAHGIEGPNPVRDDGTFDETAGELAGLGVFAANPVVARRLEERGALLRRQTWRHAVPHCWRCDQPLLYRAIPSWFVKVTAFRERMVENSRAVRWVPEHVGTGRFAGWLENARDWAVSRNRFWGAPVPVWRCASCPAVRVVGSRAELEQLSGRPLLDWHRPAIDEVELPCPDCGGTMRRVPEVLDCWFESGAMPYGQVHHPFEGGEALEKAFPGDFVAEYIAQTRGWFYTMFALSSALFDRPPFRNAVCHGVILGEDGRKMSKRLRNYPDPMVLVERHGSDALRAALLMSGAVAGLDIRFSEAAVRESVRRFHLPLWNALHLFASCAAPDGFEPSGTIESPSQLDRWLLAEVELLREQVEAAMERYDFAAAYQALEAFVALLTRWYLRLARPVLWRPGIDPEKRAACETLHATLLRFSRVSAPFLPFLAESLHQALGQEPSVHLQDWPAARPEWRDAGLVERMRVAREVVRLARRVREQHAVKQRHPLRLARVAGVPAEALSSLGPLLAAELNVKSVAPLARAEDAAGPGVAGAVEGSLAVVLDLTRDQALRCEAVARDLNRAIQDLRKSARLAYGERVVVAVEGGAEVADALAAHGAWLREQCLAELAPGRLGAPLAAAEVDLGEGTARIDLARAPDVPATPVEVVEA